MINNKIIANTIIKLMKAGKQMPQSDKLKVSGGGIEVAQKILKDTVDLFGEVFYPQKIGEERWAKAEAIALTITKADGLNVNIITPALMQTALNQVEQAYLEEARINYKQAKEEEAQPMQYGKDKDTVYRNKTLWAWTSAKIKNRIPFTEYLPGDEEVVMFGLEHGLTRSEADTNKPLIQMHLSDLKYCDECKNCNGKMCYMQGWVRTPVVVGGHIKFKYTKCER